MKERNPLVREVLMVSIGEIIVTVVMMGIFALAGFWSSKVLWGGLIGCTLAILYYCLVALGVAMATKKAEGQDVPGARRTLSLFQILRLVLLFVVAAAALRGGVANPIALVVPVFLFRPILSVCEFIRKSGEKS